MNERLSENSYTNDIISKYIRFSSNSLHTKITALILESDMYPEIWTH